MNRKLLSLLVLAMLLASGIPCLAQDAKPVVVVSFSGFDALRTDADYLGKLMGNPELAKMLDGVIAMSTEGKGLEGLDAKRPWGAVLYSKGEEFSLAVFLPTTDIKALAATMNAVNLPATDKGDGTYEVQSPMQPLVMKEQNGWALMADKVETLANLPDDPTKLLGPLSGKYDLGVMAHVANLPEGIRQMIVSQVEMGAAMGMQQQPDESEEQHAFRKAMTDRSIQQVKTMMDELDQFMLGIKIDGEAGEGTLDVAVSAKEGAKLAEQFAQVQNATTNFAGFDQPDATVSAMWSSKMTEEDAAQFKTLLTGVKSAAAEELEKQKLSDEDLAVAKPLMAELFEAIEDNIDAKTADGGMVAKLGPEQFSFVVGGAVADGAKIESLVKQFVQQLVKENPKAEEYLKLDSETHEGVTLHVLAVPVEAMDEGAEVMRKLVGDQMDVVVGIGEKSVYIAAGRSAVSELKQVIDASKAAPDKAVPPAKVSVTLSPIVDMVAELADDDSAKQMAGMMKLSLSQSVGKDRVKIETRPIPRGSMTRITLEEGVLRLIGTGAMMAQQAMGEAGGF